MSDTQTKTQENTENIITDNESTFVPLTDVKKPKKQKTQKEEKASVIPEKKDNTWVKYAVAGSGIGIGALLVYLFFKMRKALENEEIIVKDSDEEIQNIGEGVV